MKSDQITKMNNPEEVKQEVAKETTEDNSAEDLLSNTKDITEVQAEIESNIKKSMTENLSSFVREIAADEFKKIINNRVRVARQEAKEPPKPKSTEDALADKFSKFLK